jgi:hypothetical protein
MQQATAATAAAHGVTHGSCSAATTPGSGNAAHSVKVTGALPALSTTAAGAHMHDKVQGAHTQQWLQNDVQAVGAQAHVERQYT